MTEAERILPDVLKRIENLLLDLKIQKTILFRMTGCPNGCTRPYMAELALVGSGQNKYQLWLGGSKNLQRLAKPFLQRMELNDLEKTLQPLFDNWKSNLDLLNIPMNGGILVMVINYGLGKIKKRMLFMGKFKIY